MEATVDSYRNGEAATTASDIDEYRGAIRKLIHDELKKAIDEDIQNATKELVEEHKNALKQVIEEHKLVIREVVEEEKKAIRTRAEELRKSILKLGL